MNTKVRSEEKLQSRSQLIMYMHFLTLLLVKKTSDSPVDTFKDSFINIDGMQKNLRWNPPEVRVTSGQKPSTKIINIVLQTSVQLF